MSSSMIIPGLYLGGVAASACYSGVKYDRVIVIANSLTDFGGRARDLYYSMHINLEDPTRSDIGEHFAACCMQIHTWLNKGYKVLVRCVAGISRSPTTIASYLMWSRGMTTQEALEYIRARRAIIKPNANFVEALNEWQRAIKRQKINAKR